MTPQTLGLDGEVSQVGRRVPNQVDPSQASALPIANRLPQGLIHERVALSRQNVRASADDGPVQYYLVGDLLLGQDMRRAEEQG